MTDSDSAIWQQAQRDYFIALKGAAKAWAELEGEVSEVDAATLQAGATTILIHHRELLRETHIVARVPAPAAGKGGVVASPSVGTDIPPQCPRCGGAVWDNRTNKKNPKSPDWKCKDKTCVDEKGFTTGGWVAKDSPVMQRAKAQGAIAGVAAGRNFNEKPMALVDDDTESDLPF